MGDPRPRPRRSPRRRSPSPPGGLPVVDLLLLLLFFFFGHHLQHLQQSTHRDRFRSRSGGRNWRQPVGGAGRGGGGPPPPPSPLLPLLLLLRPPPSTPTTVHTPGQIRCGRWCAVGGQELAPAGGRRRPWRWWTSSSSLLFFSSATTFNLNSCLSSPPGQICDADARSGNRNSNWRRQPVGGAGRDGGPHPAQLEGKTRSALGKECVESLMEGWPRPASLRGSSRWRIPPLPDDAGAKQPANLKQARSSATTTRRRTRGGRSTRCGRLGPGGGVETTTN